MKNSYKYDKELQFSILSPKEAKYDIKERNNSNWNTIEINVSIDELDNIIKVLERFKEIVEALK